MRILFAIPHFYQSAPRANHGSQAGDAQARMRALAMCVTALRQTFGPQAMIDRGEAWHCNALVNAEIEVVVCTTGDHHLLDRLPGVSVTHRATQSEPKLLGYECHAVLAEGLGRYDYYCYLEDDTQITDPLFFWKQRWFNSKAGDRALLQPARYELSPRPPIRKLYLDGTPITNPGVAARFQNKDERPALRMPVLGVEMRFERTDNPHAGCFFLTEPQMRHWSRQSYFLDRATDFHGPLESAATLGIMRTFEIYKPAPRAAAFLEVRHLDNRYLGKRRLRRAGEVRTAAARPVSQPETQPAVGVKS